MGAAADDTRCGEWLDDAYRLDTLIDVRGPVETYAASCRDGRKVSVRVLRAEYALQPRVVANFLDLPKAVSQVRHRSLPEVVAIGSDATGIPFVVEVPDAARRSLDEWLSAYPQGLPPRKAVEVMLPLVEALAELHELGLAHGRLDGQQIGMAAPGTPRLRTWSAVIAPGTETVSSANTAPGQRIDGAAQPVADVWALGRLLVRLLTGREPASGPAAGQALSLEELQRLRVPADLQAVVRDCLEPNPFERLPDAGLLLDHLRAVATRLATPSGRAPAVPAARPLAPVSARSPDPRPASLAPGRAMRSSLPRAATHDASRPAAANRGGSRPPEATREVLRAPVSARPPAIDERAFMATAAADGSAHTSVASGGAPGADTGLEQAGFLEADFGEAGFLEADFGEADFGEAESADRDVGPAEPGPTGAPPAQPGAAFGTAQTVADSASDAACQRAPAHALSGSPMATMSALAAAFEPLATEVEQAETAAVVQGKQAPKTRERRRPRTRERGEDPAARAKRELLEREREARPVRPFLERRDSQAPVVGGSRSVAPGPAQARAQTRAEARTQAERENVAAALSEAQMARLRALRDKREDSAARRWLWLLLLLFFGISIAYATPLLVEPGMVKARALLGDKFKLAAVALAASSFVALIKVWATQVQTKALLLRPVTFGMQVSTLGVSVLVGGALLPEGALGIAATAAARFLPWAVSWLFLFGAMYGLMRAIQQFGAAMLQSAFTVALSLMAVFGSYRVVIDVNAQRAERRAQDAANIAADLKRLTDNQPPDPNDLEAVERWQAQQKNVIESRARSTVGDGRADMEEIERIRAGRRENQNALDKAKSMLPSLLE